VTTPHRVPTVLRLSAAERAELEGWARRRKTAQALARRARIVLQAAAGRRNTAIAAELGTAKHTVGKWRERFATERLEGPQDEPRGGAPRTVGDERIADLLVRTLEAAPEDATHRSTRAMAAACGLSPATVQRVWRAFGLKPHRTETFKLPADPEFVAKVRDIVGLYLSPPDRALALCVDEKTGEKTEMQALEPTQPVPPMRPGRPERRSSDHLRHGTSSLFAALDVAAGKAIGRCCRRHRAEEFRAFLDAVDGAAPAALDVHPVLDNASIHQAPPIKAWLLERPRYLPPPPHPDRELLAEPGRAFLCPTHGKAAQARGAPLGRGTGGGGAGLRRAAQRRAQAVPLDQVRRPDPRQRGALLRAPPHGARSRFVANFRGTLLALPCHV
jgi:transposase